MNITDIKFRKIFPEGKLRAIVSVTFDDLFVVHDIKVIEGINGLFIAMPNRKTSRGEYKDICHPINSEARKTIEDAIITQFKENLKDLPQVPETETVEEIETVEEN